MWWWVGAEPEETLAVRFWALNVSVIGVPLLVLPDQLPRGVERRSLSLRGSRDCMEPGGEVAED
jgi:hypothetical protein